MRLTMAAVLLSLSVGTAHAQQVVQKSFGAQLFEPAMGTDTLFAIEPASVAEHLGFGVGLMLNYQHKPLVVFNETLTGVGGGDFNIDNATETAVIRNQFTADLAGVFGFHHKWLHAQVGLGLPVNLVIAGYPVNDAGQPIGGTGVKSVENNAGIGDLRLQLKVMLLRDFKGFSVSFSPIITFPTGNDDAYGGDPNLTVRPRVVADYRIGDFMVAANLGWLFRENTLIFSSELGDRLLYGVGGSYQLHKRLIAMAEVYGQAGFDTKSGCRRDAGGDVTCSGTSATDLDAFPLEGLIGGRANLGSGFQLMAGVGFGLIKAIGSPQARILAGVRWAPDFTDTDKDGIYDGDDKCPTQPEDIDGYSDSDGCPDPDNDSDLIPDVRDRCPNEAEDKDTFQDDDGCPDLDNDGDGIPDIKDNCPFKAETKNGFKDDDGCPDVPDKDGDGVADAQDKCPTEPEDKDGFQDEDGCPDPDNDADGVPDKFDDCPLQAEDVDGFQDDDGCPDPDNDGDGVPDAQDKCPNKPETINGIKDDDGCPDKGQAQVQIKENKIVITKKVYFETGKSKIRRVSFSILNQVGLVLKANPRVRGVRVEGHTDSRGNDDKNKQLSQRRAEAVRDYLIGVGVEPARLFAVGYGEDRPVDSNKTGRGRENNRRVEFVILDNAPGEEKKETPVQSEE